MTTMVAILEELGFIINTDKSVLCPTQQLEFLGLLVNTVDLHLRLPGEKVRQIQNHRKHILRSVEILMQVTFAITTFSAA